MLSGLFAVLCVIILLLGAIACTALALMIVHDIWLNRSTDSYMKIVAGSVVALLGLLVACGVMMFICSLFGV